MSRRASPARTAPALAPRDGLRQRQRADGTWRVWWEPTAGQRKAGAGPVDLSHLRPGEAQRRATALAAQWSGGQPGATQPRGRSIDALIADYLASRYFTDLAATTQASYRHDLRAISDKWGVQPVPAMTPPLMVSWYEALLAARGPSRARAILTMAGILFRHAERRGWIAKGANPAREIGMKRAPVGTRIASAEELQALAAIAADHDEMVFFALRLACVTGQRLTDILAASAGQFGAEVLHLPDTAATAVPAMVWRFIRSKRGNAAVIPILDEWLHAAITVLSHRHPTGPLIRDGHGKPMTLRRFGTRFAAIRDRAAHLCPSIATLEWRAIRRTVGVRARALGLGRDDVGDLLGNTLAHSAELSAAYTPATTATTLRVVAAITEPERKKA